MEWAWRLRKTEASWDSSAVFWTGDHEKLGQNHGGGNGKKGTQLKTIEEVVLEGLGDTEYGAVMGVVQVSGSSPGGVVGVGAEPRPCKRGSFEDDVEFSVTHVSWKAPRESG